MPDEGETQLDEPFWNPTPRWTLWAWVALFSLFMLYAWSRHGGFLFMDNVNLVVHEGGHMLFSWFGRTLCLWGGTLLQWLVPLLLALLFLFERQILGFVFCAFVFFENWLYTATYMADARAMQLPLVSVGDGGGEEGVVMHDWWNIFTQLGVLEYDTRIAAVVRAVGWMGMLGVTAWVAWRAWSLRTES